MDVNGLLRSKNRCLKRYLELTLSFANSCEQSELAGLPEFESRRDATLKALNLYDRKISETISLLPTIARDTGFQNKIKEALNETESLINLILSADERILAKINSEKDRLAIELNSAQKSKISLSRFKSAWITESGEGLDTKI